LKPLLIATHNADKLREFEKLLAPKFSCRKPDGAWPVPEEIGKTYRENAEMKARSLYRFAKTPCLSDDSGLEIDALDGAPGVHSADFGGEGISWQERWNYTYAKLLASKQTNWSARFRCVLCYFDGKTAQFFEGTTEGEIAAVPKGTHGFGYDPIFYSRVLRCTLGEASDEQKASVSHRARAAQAFLSFQK